MINSINEQVQEFFASKQEWESFMLLYQNKDIIRNNWFTKLKGKINSMPIPDGWGLISWGVWDFRWFLKDYEANSLCLWQCANQNYYSLCLWANGNKFDRKKIYDLLQNPKYSLIKSTFDRIDDIWDSNNDYRIIERGNYLFEGEASSGNLDIDKLAWYANYKTEELASQIITKVNKFITNSEITELFREINESSKI